MRLLFAVALILVSGFCADGLEVEFQPGPSDGKDTFVSSANPDNNYASHIHVYIGHSTDTEATFRGFIEFTGLDSYITEGYICEEAILAIEVLVVTPGTSDQYEIHRVEEDWSESSVTWNDQPAYGGTPVTFGEPWTGVYTIDVTTIVSEWFNDTADHHGFCIKHEDEASEESGNFGCYSSNDSLQSNRPLLMVTLTGEAVEPSSLGRTKAAFR